MGGSVYSEVSIHQCHRQGHGHGQGQGKARPDGKRSRARGGQILKAYSPRRLVLWLGLGSGLGLWLGLGLGLGSGLVSGQPNLAIFGSHFRLQNGRFFGL